MISDATILVWSKIPRMDSMVINSVVTNNTLSSIDLLTSLGDIGEAVIELSIICKMIILYRERVAIGNEMLKLIFRTVCCVLMLKLNLTVCLRLEAHGTSVVF